MREYEPKGVEGELDESQLQEIVDSITKSRPQEAARIACQSGKIFVDGRQMPNTAQVELGDQPIPLESFILGQIDG